MRRPRGAWLLCVATTRALVLRIAEPRDGACVLRVSAAVAEVLIEAGDDAREARALLAGARICFQIEDAAGGATEHCALPGAGEAHATYPDGDRARAAATLATADGAVVAAAAPVSVAVAAGTARADRAGAKKRRARRSPFSSRRPRRRRRENAASIIRNGRRLSGSVVVAPAGAPKTASRGTRSRSVPRRSARLTPARRRADPCWASRGRRPVRPSTTRVSSTPRSWHFLPSRSRGQSGLPRKSSRTRSSSLRVVWGGRSTRRSWSRRSRSRTPTATWRSSTAPPRASARRASRTRTSFGAACRWTEAPSTSRARGGNQTSGTAP